jgi:hypothetical protein
MTSEPIHMRKVPDFIDPPGSIFRPPLSSGKPSRGIIGPKRVIQVEIVDGLDWGEAISPDGVCCYVAQLRRPQALQEAA